MANAITLVRIPLLFIYIALLQTGRPKIIFWCIPFIVLIMLLDMVDGIVARHLNQASLLGSTLDIAVDRALEIILWVVFSCLGLIPLLIPLIVITRGTLTDAVRCVGTCNGEAAFNQIKNPINRFLVSSRFMRDFYGGIKGTTFAVLTLDLGLQVLEHAWTGWVHSFAIVLTWLTITLTIVRGVPVIVEEVTLLKKSSSSEA
ncbi:MAG: CDP-alcohol phosphatidyltransferase family protein [Desulfobacula sp.]|nr:CDP-alcohol phosphatidyltransferase family protein [Desulfobacula sp.]